MRRGLLTRSVMARSVSGTTPHCVSGYSCTRLPTLAETKGPRSLVMTRVTDTDELSPLQAGMLFHSLDGALSGVHIEQVVATLCEPIDPAHLLRAWERILERHPIMRTRFLWEGLTAPRQEVVD